MADPKRPKPPPKNPGHPHGSTPPHGPSVTRAADGSLEYRESNGTSIFDPVLCELIYRWFCPPGGLVLDPFAGGSVRGIVAAKLGRRYVGIDLRPEQVAANEKQAARICAQSGPPADHTPRLTPIEEHGGHLVKRDDLFQIGGVSGGKVRSCWHLAQGAAGLVTAGSRSSPQVNIVAHIARRLGIPCRVHTPAGALSAEVVAAQRAGAEVVQHRAGYNNVIVARAREDARARGWREIPFGMECPEAIEETRGQAANLPAAARRIVIPVGSGMSLAGVLHGLRDLGRALPVVGVVVGADPQARLDQYAPAGWRAMATLVPSGSPYDRPAPRLELGALRLDSHYEAKCLPVLEPGDLLWCVGIRQSETPAAELAAAPMMPQWIVGDAIDLPALAPEPVDLVFSCPPYGDLEVYSDDPRDLSTLAYADFLTKYRAIVAQAVAQLRPDRFACFVVGDLRDKHGYYRGFISATAAAFEDAGARLYNEAILVTAVGSLPIRVTRMFESARKLGKTHQNVLIFVKGDAAKATAAIGIVERGDVPESEAASV